MRLVFVYVLMFSWPLPAEESKIPQGLLFEDARQLLSSIESAHPDPYSSGGGKIRFHRRFHEVLASIPTDGLTATEFYRLLLPFVASVGDGHTAIRPARNTPSTPSGFPLQFGLVENSMYVKKEMTLNGEPLLGARLTGLEGVGMEDLLKRQNNLRGIENIYGTMALLGRSLQTREGLSMLLPEWKGQDALRCALLLPDGRKGEFLIPLGKNVFVETGELLSRIALPDLEKTDVAFTFLDGRKQTALLAVKDMMAYREGCESWFSDGLSEAEDFTRAAYARFHHGEPPNDIKQVLKGIPSAAETFCDLGAAMRDAGTQTLIVDLRDNGGGNGYMIRMLLYVLFGEKVMREYKGGYSIAKYSDLFFKVYESADLGLMNKGRTLPLQPGDYDFLEEDQFKKGARGSENINVEIAKSQTFQAIYSTGRFAGEYTPPRIIVLSSAMTYSSGFNLMTALKKHGAILVGTPSAQPGNNYGDSLILQLKNTGIQAFVAFKQILTYPDDPVRGRCLPMDHLMTYEMLSSYGFDPNAEVLLALDIR